MLFYLDVCEIKYSKTTYAINRISYLFFDKFHHHSCKNLRRKQSLIFYIACHKKINT